MAFFDEIGKRLSDAAGAIGKKTNELGELNRLNGQISGHNREIEALHARIGKMYCDARKNGGDLDAVNILSERVAELEKQITVIKRQIDKVKREQHCPSCDSVQVEGAKFCSNCGAKMPQPEKKPEPVISEPEDEPEDEPEEKPDKAPARTGCKGDLSVEINWPKAQDKAPDAPDEEDSAEAEVEHEKNEEQGVGSV